MTSQFSLSWDAHQKNICNGLSHLQQNNEFVDMTLAADGHLVKVHQVIMALASPYVKELIHSANCPHPIIFLNNISYTTLCNILEYIYTGEVLVSIENLNDLIEAAKNLHIKGLEEMNLKDPKRIKISDNNIMVGSINEEETLSLKIQDPNNDASTFEDLKNESSVYDTNVDYDSTEENITEPTEPYIVDKCDTIEMTATTTEKVSEPYNKLKNKGCGTLQYTVSNQGSLQMILNRYIYYLKHTNRNNVRQWRCVDYVNSRCPAYLTTKGDMIMQRISAHTHAYHDKKILKKYKVGSIFSAIHDAQEMGIIKKKNKDVGEEANTD